MSIASITIQRKTVEQRGGVVVLPIAEYKKLLSRYVPTYYLSGKAAGRLDRLVENGLHGYRLGKTRKIRSLRDLGWNTLAVRMMQISLTRKFEYQYRKLSRSVQEKAHKKEEIFRKNPFDQRLETHKLHGKEKEALAFSVDYSCRIKFIFLTHDHTLFLEIGGHDIYK